jgi:ribosomal protein S18 acetylase RimI-like enzyme
MTTETKAILLAPGQMRDVGEVLAKAFFDDPHWSWVFPREARRAQVMPWFMATLAKYCRRHGDAYTTAGGVKGAALWMAPGKYARSATAMMLSGLGLVPLKFGPAAFGRLMSSLNCYERLSKRDVPPRHWYLPTLGVDPPHQGQGIGGILLRPGLARADAEGLWCYLETEGRACPSTTGMALKWRQGDLPKAGHFLDDEKKPQRRPAD